MERYDYLRQFHPITIDDYALLMDNMKTKHFSKGETIVEPGQVQRNLYFIVEGEQMAYLEHEDKVHVVAFTYAPGPCAVPGSFSFQQPSKYYVKALSDTETSHISYDKLNQLFEKSRGLETLFRKITEAILAGMIDRHMELHTLSMEERYSAFCRRSPHLLQAVPQKYIASYLDIDATNFSKLMNTVRV